MTTTFAASRSADCEAPPWLVDEGGFPADGSDDCKLAWLVRWAALAPSGDNTPPWAFRIEGGTLDLHADRTGNRELIIRCGAALFHVWLALRHYGYAGDIDLYPELCHPDLLARIRLGEMRPPTAEGELLFSQIPRSHTHRGPFGPSPLSPDLIAALQAAAAEEGAWLQILDDKAPVLAVLGTEEDDVLAWLEAGEALAHVLLRARRDGVWASLLNLPIDAPELRAELRQGIGRTGYPQMLLRLWMR